MVIEGHFEGKKFVPVIETFRLSSVTDIEMRLYAVDPKVSATLSSQSDHGQTWGKRYFLMLSADPAANEYSWGCAAIARMLFLWYVSVDIVLPFLRSHILMVLSWLPVMI